uniref:Uncharacterized protein n=1 Tax=Anopheles culicifacies TaxID=139723 RepID=A0A182MQV8_9DIPT
MSSSNGELSDPLPAGPNRDPTSDDPTARVRFGVALEPLLTVLWIVVDLVKVILLGVPLVGREIYSMFVPRREKDVRGRVVLVTGGGNGLGRAMAQLLAARGCHLVLVDIDLDAAERTAAEIKQQYGVAARAYRVDVSRYDECRELAERVERDGAGPVDILINNAGLMFFAFVNDPDIERANTVMDVNLKSHVWVSSFGLRTPRPFRSGASTRERVKSSEALEDHPIFVEHGAEAASNIDR